MHCKDCKQDCQVLWKDCYGSAGERQREVSMTDPVVAVIGTRHLEEVSQEAQREFFQRIRNAFEDGICRFRTGGAPGTDQVAAEYLLRRGAEVQVVLPWLSFESTWQRKIKSLHGGRLVRYVYDPKAELFRVWRESVDKYHPAPQRLSSASRALLARDYGVVKGVEYVLALPSPRRKGGTDYTLRVAQMLGVPTMVVSE